MRKGILGIVTFLLSMALFLPCALAEEMKVSVTATPTALSDSGTVAFTFVVSNYSDYEMSNLTITYQGTAYEILKDQAIPMNGEARDIVLSLPVTQAQLDKPIQFTVSGVRSGETITQTAEVTIARSSDPAITAERTLSAEKARQGEKVKLTYTLKNDTKFDIADITVIDENISDNPIVKLEKLLAGATYSIDYEYTMGEENVTTTPFITYTINGKTKTFSGIESKEIAMLLVKLDLKVEYSSPTAAGITFTLTTKNVGNQKVVGISIKDEKGNVLNDAPFSLNVGETATNSFQVVPDMNEQERLLTFHLTGADELGGAYKLDSADIYAIHPYVEDSQINVTARAETVTPWTSENGAVTVRIVLENYSQVDIRNVVISESVFGEIKKLDGSLPKGESAFEQSLSLGSPRNLQFSVKGADPSGTVRTLGECTLPVAYMDQTADLAVTPVPELDTNMAAFQFLSSTISKVLVGLGVVMVVAFIVLITLSIAERARASGNRFNLIDVVEPDDEDEDDEEGDELDRLFDDAPETAAPVFNKGRKTGVHASDGDRDTVRRGRAAPAAPPIQLPPPMDGESARRNTVPIEYEDTYEGQRSYSPNRGKGGRDADSVPKPVYRDYETDDSMDWLHDDWQEDEEDLPTQAHRPPKVIEYKKKPAVVPKSRNQIRRVRPKDDGKKE